MFKDLQEFVQLLEKKGELKRIQAEVDPVLEISEIYHYFICKKKISIEKLQKLVI